MRDAGLTAVALALDARQQQCQSRMANACEGYKTKELYHYPTPGAPVGRVAATEHACGRRAVTMWWPDPAEKAAVKFIMLEEDATATRAAERRPR